MLDTHLNNHYSGADQNAAVVSQATVWHSACGRKRHHAIPKSSESDKPETNKHTA